MKKSASAINEGYCGEQDKDLQNVVSADRLFPKHPPRITSLSVSSRKRKTDLL